MRTFSYLNLALMNIEHFHIRGIQTLFYYCIEYLTLFIFNQDHSINLCQNSVNLKLVIAQNSVKSKILLLVLPTCVERQLE